VRLGTSIRSVIAEFGGFIKDGGKIIVNGILMGHNVTDLDTPITKEVKSVSIIPPKDVMNPASSECIRCGMCRTVCPMGMSPDILYGHYAFNREISQNHLNTLRNCSDCVLCNAVCPARLPLCQSIKLLRGAINEKK
jgi:electron transport complex protein RnfC